MKNNRYFPFMALLTETEYNGTSLIRTLVIRKHRCQEAFPRDNFLCTIVFDKIRKSHNPDKYKLQGTKMSGLTRLHCTSIIRLSIHRLLPRHSLVSLLRRVIIGNHSISRPPHLHDKFNFHNVIVFTRSRFKMPFATSLYIYGPALRWALVITMYS